LDAGIPRPACRPYPSLHHVHRKPGPAPQPEYFYLLVTLLDISVDRFFYPDTQNAGSEQRKHIDTMLNGMDGQELTIIEGTAEAIRKARKIGEK